MMYDLSEVNKQEKNKQIKESTTESPADIPRQKT